MSVRGWVTACKLVNQGSELTADVAVSATALPVDWVGDFNDAGGTLRLNDVDLEYTGVDRVAETVTLAVPLAVAASDGDRVDVVTSGQVLKDYTLFVTLGQGDDAQVDIPYGDRDAWPEGDYDEPVEIVLSNDLETIEAVPGVMPLRRVIGGYIATNGSDEGQRIVIRDDGNGGIIELFGGYADETPGSLDPAQLSGRPNVSLRPSTTPTYAEAPRLMMNSGTTASQDHKMQLTAGQISLDASDTLSGAVAIAAAAGSVTISADLGISLSTPGNEVTVGDDLTVFGLLEALGGVSVNSGAVLVTTGGHVIAEGNGSFGGTLTNSGHATTTDPVNTRITTDGVFLRVTSLRSAKVAIDDVPLDRARRILNVPAHTWFDRAAAEAYAACVDAGADESEIGDIAELRRIPGMIVEEMLDAGIPELVDHEDGEPIGLMYERVVAYVVPVVADIDDRVAALEALVVAQQQQIDALMARLAEEA